MPESAVEKFNLSDFEPLLDELKDDWEAVLETNWRIVTPVAFGIFMALLLFVVGIVWCSVRCCCGGCGSKAKESKSSDGISSCLQVHKWGNLIFVFSSPHIFQFLLQGTAFLVLMLVAWWGVVWNITANVDLQDGVVEKFTPFIENAIDDVNLYIDNTVEQVRHLTSDNLDELNEDFIDAVDETAGLFQTVADDILTGEAQFERLVNMTDFLAGIVIDFEDTVKYEIEAKINSMSDNLTAVETSVTNFQGAGEWASITAFCGTSPSGLEVHTCLNVYLPML